LRLNQSSIFSYVVALVGSFWTGGTASSASDGFVWDGSDEKVPDGKNWSKSPWKKELPNLRTEKSRVILEQTNTPETFLSFADESERKRYICEDVRIMKYLITNNKLFYFV